MKTILNISLSVLACLVLVVACHKLDRSSNHGLTIGYYGDFNRVRNELSAIPGIQVTKDWSNNDLTLEEFGFEIMSTNGHTTSISFGENDPIRRLRGTVLRNALKSELTAAITRQTNYR